MSDYEQSLARLRAAIEAGPTPGEWHWDSDPLKGDQLGRVRFRVCTRGKTITHIYYSSFEGGPTNAEQDAAYMAAANPDTISKLIAERDALKVNAKRARKLLIEYHEIALDVRHQWAYREGDEADHMLRQWGRKIDEIENAISDAAMKPQGNE